MRYDTKSLVPFALLLTAAAFVLLLPAQTVRAQTPITVLENAAGDSVFVSYENGAMLALGEFQEGVIPIEGPGVRMMWFPRKAAFRAGRVAGTQWDDANVGRSSVAFGLGNTASGIGSVAMGARNVASGDYSTVIGGARNVASGDYAMALGRQTNATGRHSTTMGRLTTASGTASMAVGSRTIASGTASMAVGLNTIASGNRAGAMGLHTVAATNNSLTIGRWNLSNRDSTRFLFVVGNGVRSNRSDALTLTPNGNLTIAGTLTENSDRRLKEDIEPLGEDVLEKLGAIRPVRFRFKNEQTHPSSEQIGLIAQEVQAQFPELVTKGASGYLSVSYTKFTAVLLKAVQEQQAQIEKQQAQIEALQAQPSPGAPLAGVLPAAGLLLGALLVGGVIVWRRRGPLG